MQIKPTPKCGGASVFLYGHLPDIPQLDCVKLKFGVPRKRELVFVPKLMSGAGSCTGGRCPASSLAQCQHMARDQQKKEATQSGR